MVPKTTRTNRIEVIDEGVTPLRLGYAGWEYGEPGSPHLLYANADFEKPDEEGTRSLLVWLKKQLRSKWDDSRILRYLEQNQEEFRTCLEWVSNNCALVFDGDDEESGAFEEMWRQAPEVKCLQKHGIDHGGLKLVPESRGEGFGEDTSVSFSGLQLMQMAPRDPLDPICWYVIYVLFAQGTIFARRCRYVGCKKFFQPATKRKQFCCDSCRALDFALLKEVGRVWDEEKEEEFRNHRKKYMREYRANIVVKKRQTRSKNSSGKR
jgi:hypothetical protein